MLCLCLIVLVMFCIVFMWLVFGVCIFRKQILFLLLFISLLELELLCIIGVRLFIFFMCLMLLMLCRVLIMVLVLLWLLIRCMWIMGMGVYFLVGGFVCCIWLCGGGVMLLWLWLLCVLIVRMFVVFKIYDCVYFDKWYCYLDYIVVLFVELCCKVVLVVVQVEYYFGCFICSVFDVGCGEVLWCVYLCVLCLEVSYCGLDVSEYVVNCYGCSCNIGLVIFGQFEYLCFDICFDFIVCIDVLYYFKFVEICVGFGGIVDMFEGIVFFEVFICSDDFDGDMYGFVVCILQWYLCEFQQVGLLLCGLYCYLGLRLEWWVVVLERVQVVV